MQSFSVYKVSEFNKDRYPYIKGLRSPLRDPNQVSIAYNENCIPRLANLLHIKLLSSDKRTDALHTLNELVSNQEMKMQMIDHNIVSYASCLTVDECSNTRKEASLLLGSLLYLREGRKKYANNTDNYTLLHTCLYDSNIEAKTATSWMIYRLSLHRDGVEMINNSKTTFVMIDAFIKYSTLENFIHNVDYLTYLLDSYINITSYEDGIKNLLNKGLLKTFTIILYNKDYKYSSKISKGAFIQIKEYILNVVKNIMLLKEGKQEAIKEGMIECISNYLTSNIENERLFASSFMMSVSNDISSKKIISNYVDENDKYSILEINKFISYNKDVSDNNETTIENTKKNSIIALLNISELPDAFLKIVNILHNDIILLNEVFGLKALKGLAELLPKLSSYKNPPNVDKDKLPLYSKYIKGIIYFIKTYDDEAISLLVNETINFNQKLAPFFILMDNKMHKQAKGIINRICLKDYHNAQIFQRFIEKYSSDRFKNLTKDVSESLHLSEIS